jgi:hypothetical protein
LKFVAVRLSVRVLVSADNPLGWLYKLDFLNAGRINSRKCA